MGLSEQVQVVLNHGHVRVDGVTTRYSHLQHIQVRLFAAAGNPECCGGWWRTPSRG